MRINMRSIGLILLGIIGAASAADKSPNQILNGKPAATGGSARYYDGKGAFAGRQFATGNTTQQYDSKGKFDGRIDASKNSTRTYDSKGAYSGRTANSGNKLNFTTLKAASTDAVPPTETPRDSMIQKADIPGGLRLRERQRDIMTPREKW